MRIEWKEISNEVDSDVDFTTQTGKFEIEKSIFTLISVSMVAVIDEMHLIMLIDMTVKIHVKE